MCLAFPPATPSTVVALLRMRQWLNVLLVGVSGSKNLPSDLVRAEDICSDTFERISQPPNGVFHFYRVDRVKVVCGFPVVRPVKWHRVGAALRVHVACDAFVVVTKMLNRIITLGC